MERVDHKYKCLRVSGEVMASLKEMMTGANTQKIQAIKELRRETNCGLREAKIAIEKKFQGDKFSNPDAYDIRPLLCVKSVTVDFGQGDVKLDLEELQMMTLVNMNEIGLSEVRRVLDLHELLTKWESMTSPEED